jgi:two-component system, OmpR family, phosphate regulon sensor histidine kinase PhoR
MWIAWAVIIVGGLLWYIQAAGLRRRLLQSQQQLRESEQAREELEARLTRRMRRLDILLSTMSEAVLLVDRDCRVIVANPVARTMFGMSEIEEDRARPMVWFYRDPDWNQVLGKAMSGTMEAQDLPDMIVGDRVLAPRLAPIGPDQALLVCLDVTERSKLARQRDEFLANLMHDLKTPLTSMLGYARSLANFGEDADFRKMAGEVIATEAKRVNELLDALLTLDQIRFVPHDPEAHCEISEVIERVQGSTAGSAAAKDVRFAVQIPESGLPPLAIAEDELMRILTNIVENAVRFSPESGEITVEVSLHGRNMQIVVNDEGPGIPEADLPHVTERFYRVDRARGRGGHGLGLAIVRELVETRHGVLALSNRAPHGLQVSVQLPTYAEAEAEAA